ncbi:MAG TPA: sulfate ABC transporter permease subunit CysT [Rhizomicrobium sp.]|nr:sulfate ABC transporter permease subunit CysT [Rhizomicrobium sp.]
MSGRRAIPGLALTLGTTLVYLTLIAFLPIAALLLKAASLGWADFVSIATTRRALSTYRVTILCAAYATLFNAAFGLLLAWILTRYQFWGRRVLDGLVDLPFALPTAVAGVALVTLFVPNGWLGQWLEPLGIKVAFALPGIVIAMAFTSLPFVVRSVQPVLMEMNRDVEDAGMLLGASDFQIFRRIILPQLLPALLSGCALAFGRSLGEFGAVIFIAGNIPLKTEIVSLLTIIRIEEFEYSSAAALAVVMLAAAFVMFFVTNALQIWYGKRAGAR